MPVAMNNQPGGRCKLCQKLDQFGAIRDDTAIFGWQIDLNRVMVANEDVNRCSLPLSQIAWKVGKNLFWHKSVIELPICLGSIPM
jgi:hypothetical protein